MLPWIINAVCVCLAWSSAALAYVPAHAANFTDPQAIRPTNASSSSVLNITSAFDSPLKGAPVAPIQLAYLAAGPATRGLSQGVLLEFDQQTLSASDPNTNASWVALVSCDGNITSTYADGVDVFADAQQRGATAVVLYTQNSGNSGCVLEPAFRTSDQAPLDIYSLYSLNDTKRVFNLLTSSPFHMYNEALLAAHASSIAGAIQNARPVSAEFLLATVSAWNATAVPADSASNEASSAATTSSASKLSRPTTAMIVLYVITGFVSALFILIIASGAIRAVRHPERYGPRGSAGPDAGATPQTRTQGLSRAIVDTFAVVRFRAPAADAEAGAVPQSRSSSMDKGPWELVELPAAERDGKRESVAVVFEPAAGPSSPAQPPTPPVVPRVPPPAPADEPVLPDAIGRETCPICIVDFEDDDALRVLPCAGQHRFHQACVDPWLLELSSSCPLCRQDFAALESLIAGDDVEPLTPTSPQHPRASQGRFTRYIRLARRRTLERRGAGGALAVPQTRSRSHSRTREADVRRYAADPTDPYMPAVPTAL